MAGRTRVDTLYNMTMNIIKRDVGHIRLLAVGGKLPPMCARDLVAYTKLLKELKEEEVRLKELRTKNAESLSDTELEQLAQASLAASKGNSQP